MTNAPTNTQWIELPGADGAFGGFLALPPAGHGPGLLLLQEIFGVNPHIRGVAEQYALAGFVVLAPDLFWRQGERIELGYSGEDWQRAVALMNTVQPDTVLSDLQAALRALRGRPEMTCKVGILGYCMGGRLAYTAAALCEVDAAVAYYGGGIQQQLGLAPKITCPIQLHYGERDDHIPPEAVEAVRDALAEQDAEIHVYPGAQHGFNCWARASHHPASAALAHGRSLAFLAQLF
jgi:carboxymethylenebutenolidase